MISLLLKILFVVKMSRSEEAENPKLIDPRVRREVRKAYLECLGTMKGKKIFLNNHMMFQCDWFYRKRNE